MTLYPIRDIQDASSKHISSSLRFWIPLYSIPTTQLTFEDPLRLILDFYDYIQLNPFLRYR
eukprot:jgi/Psemu1/61148/gm1.61148_g